MNELRETSAATAAVDARRRVIVVCGVLGAVLLVGWWGEWLLGRGEPLHLGVPPLYAKWRLDSLFATWVDLWLPALLLALALVVAVPLWWVRAATRLHLGSVLLGAWTLALAWSAALGATDGPDRLSAPLLDPRFEYLPLARRIGSPGEFVSTFVERLPTMPTHVRGHPPGAVLAFIGLDAVFPTDTSITWAVLAIGASSVPAAILAVRALSGERAARRAAPFLGLAPAAIWMATSADALFTGVIAWAVALSAMALASRGRAAVALGAGAGLLAGVSVSLSYGAVALLAPMAVLVVVLIARRRLAEPVALVLGAAIVPVALSAAGFDWFDGIAAVREEYLAGVGSIRPQWYFAVANWAGFAIALGPAAIAGIATLRDRALWWLVGGALGGLLVADLSGMSKGEVERIWLPAVPWVTVATASIRGVRTRSTWVAVTMLSTVVLQWRLVTPW